MIPDPSTEPTQESPLEARLRRELHRPAAAPTDPQILAEIRKRIANSTGDSHHRTPRRVYNLVLAAASIAVGLIAVTAISAGTGWQTIQPASPTAPPQSTGPSSWWLALALIGAAGLVVAVHRRLARPLLSVGLALACAGLLFWAAMVFPYLHAGNRLAAEAPELEGYDLVEAEVPWPNADGFTLARLRYQPNPGTEAISADPGAANGYLALGRRLGFDGGNQRLGKCLQRVTNDAFDAEFYCIDQQAGTDLMVRATVFDTDGLLVGRSLGLPILILGTGLMALAAIIGLVEKRRGI